MPVVYLEMKNLSVLLPKYQQESPSDSCIIGNVIPVYLYRKQSEGQSPSLKGLLKSLPGKSGNICPCLRKWECLILKKVAPFSVASLLV